MKLQNVEFKGNVEDKRMGIYSVIEGGVVAAIITTNIPRNRDNSNEPIEFIANTCDVLRQRRDNYLGRFPTLIEARVKVMEYLSEHPQQKQTASPKYLPADENNEFYPTPTKIAGMMLSGIDWWLVETVLEPTAGKGDLANCAKLAAKGGGKHRWGDNRIDVDCIEIDSNLRHILKGEGYRVVHDDFLTFNGKKKYDLILIALLLFIILELFHKSLGVCGFMKFNLVNKKLNCYMNPPFSCGDKHLLKALDIQKYGGSVICLLNAETLKNPYSNTRKMLVNKLEDLDAKIIYIKDGFLSAERKTGVEIAIVKVFIPLEEVESDIYERMRKAENCFVDDIDATDICVTDLFQNMVSHFNVEVNASLELIKQYKALEPYILNTLKETTYASPILKLTAGSGSNLKENDCIKDIRMKYWNALLSNNKITGRLTSAERDKYYKRVFELGDYDFSLYNIEQIIAQMNSEIISGIKKAIMVVFDKMSAEHTYNTECSKNIHYFNGWKTNKAHKIGKKVILPVWGVFSSYTGKPEAREAYNALGDIEKVFNYLNGKAKDEDLLWSFLENAFERGVTKNIDCKYFTATFYKKGTVHITFKNEKDVEGKSVIDEFQGENKYQKVMENPKEYIFDVAENSMLLLSA